MQLKEERSGYEPIENYGMIGDMHTVALVSIKGSIDYMCLDRYDLPTIFAALLDDKTGGYFSIEPVLESIEYKQLYIPDTAILITRFLSVDGIAELTDFMPVSEGTYRCTVIRKVKTIRGKIKYQMNCKPRFEYATVRHSVRTIKEGIVFQSEPDKWKSLTLLSDTGIEMKGTDAYSEFTLSESESASFILTCDSRERITVKTLTSFIETEHSKTIHYWNKWLRKSKYRGRWRETVNRSMITLKLLLSAEFGAPVAAATFGLPEIIGGEKNWDYRFTWVRDAAFTMYAFLNLGFMEEADAFIAWVRDRFFSGDLQLMYSIDGGKSLDEYTLDHMRGYRDSRPVRIGNKAHRQFQLDIYGELIDTIYLYNKDGGAITYDFWLMISKHIEFIISNWRKPDNGMWETRDGEKQFLQSTMMCWVAIDRAIKIAEARSFTYPVLRWRETRDTIFNDIYFNFWNEEKECFVQYPGASVVDGGVLLMSLMRILSPEEEKWRKTLEAVDRELRSDVLIFRNRNDSEQGTDHLKWEGTFTMCSFWYVECLAKIGQIQKAREYFSKILAYANPIGLFSEQLGPRGEHLGNFPQAFTHLALISAAIELDKDLISKK